MSQWHIVAVVAIDKVPVAPARSTFAHRPIRASRIQLWLLIQVESPSDFVLAHFVFAMEVVASKFE
jgi:hypothetical protein